MFYIDWGLFALGLFIGIVGTVSAMLACVVVEYTEYELFKDNHKDQQPATSNQQRGTRPCIKY